VIQKARKITCPVGEKYLPNWENKKVMKTRLQASKRVVSQSTSSKRNLRKEEKAKLSRGQKKNHEPEHEGIHPVSHRGDLLSHRHLPIQLLHGRTRNRKEPAATSGEQHLHQSRFYLLRANHHHQVVYRVNS